MLADQAARSSTQVGGAEALGGTRIGITPQAGFSRSAAWAGLSDTASLESFAAAWLDLQCLSIGEVESAVVLWRHDDGTYRPLSQWPDGAVTGSELRMAAESAIERRCGVVRPGTPAARRLDALAYPLLLDEHPYGVVAIEVVYTSEAHLHEIMRVLQWGCAWWYRRLGRDPVSLRDPRIVLELLAIGLQEKAFQAAAMAVVTELAARFGCERVSFGTLKGRRFQIRAISNSAGFNTKSSLIRALAAAMQEAVAQQTTLVLPPVDERVALVTERHQALSDQQNAVAVCTIPLSDRDRLISALTLERDGNRPFMREEIRICEHLGTLIGPVLEAKRREDRWIGQKIWEAGWEFLARLLGPSHSVTKALTLSFLIVVLFLVFATGDYRITAPARLEGTVQRAITAPQDGYIAQAPVRAGDVVDPGQDIVALEDKELRLERVQWEGEREKFLREYSQALAARDRAQVRIIGARVEQAEAHIARLSDQIERTRLVAPFAGLVVSGDLRQSLGAPVSRGDVLYEIAPLDSYRVILNVNEHDISQLRLGQTGTLALAGFPDKRLSVRIEKITPVSNVEQGQNSFRVEAGLDGDISALRPGMRGVAKIDVEPRRLFWIWTHRPAYWLRLWWWSWWP